MTTCTCTHTSIDHLMADYGPKPTRGRGKCTVKDCGCKKFKEE
jgi:hypothetical protein